MIQFKDNGKTRFYFDEYTLLRERGEGNGDSTWRTSLMLIATGNKKILEAVKKQVHKIKGKYRYTRHPEQEKDDTSRDTSIVAHISLKLNDPEFYEEVRKTLSFRISKKFTWQESFFWAKEKYNWWIVLSFYHCFSIWVQDSYSVHLLCWMIWHSKRKRTILRWLLLKTYIPKWNYLLRMLLKDEVTEIERAAIENYKPRIDFVWQRHFDPKKHRLMTESESTANCLDKIVLDYVYNWFKLIDNNEK